MRIVISQSMLFPWVGLLDQVRHADVFVHYDDVQFSKGSFVNRVQIKTPQGMRWMTVPLKDLRLGQRIQEVQVAPIEQWRGQHLDMLRRSFSGAPHANEALQLAECVYDSQPDNIGALARRSMRALVDYFGIGASTRFVDVQDLDVPGSGSDRVLAVVTRLGGDTYVTGHGAARYLDHDGFEAQGVDVQYMHYRCQPYPQAHGAFTPYVSALDLVAHCGRDGLTRMCSGTVGWRDHLALASIPGN